MTKKKTLIFQIDIDVGTQWGDEPVGKFIREYCIPSVKKYCTKHGYDYQLFTESQYEKHGGKFDFLLAKLKHYAIDKYYHLDYGYEKMIYLDTDIYVSEYAGKLPDIRGVMCALESGGVSKNLFQKVNNLPSSYPYFNAGVFMLDEPSAVNLKEYMMYRINNRIKAKGKNTDNMMLNEYFLEKKEFINLSILDNKWNYMPTLPNNIKLNSINFFHFVGIVGKILINFMIQHNIKINDFITHTSFEFVEDKLMVIYLKELVTRKLTILLPK